MTTYAPLPGSRDITLRSANFSVTRDSFTGQRVPTFTESTITGTLVERTGDMPAFAVGLAIVQNAILFTRDTTVKKLDEILADSKYYKVLEIHEEFDADADLVYRACHLQLLDIVHSGAAPVQMTLTIEADSVNPTWGTTNPAPGVTDHNEGANVVITAFPTGGHALDYWVLDDESAGSSNPIIVAMDSDHTLRPVWKVT